MEMKSQNLKNDLTYNKSSTLKQILELLELVIYHP